MKKRLCYAVIEILVLSFMMLACKPKESWLNYLDACEPPCWQNITPGETTKEELQSLLESNPLVDHASITFQSTSFPGSSWNKIFNDIADFSLIYGEHLRIYLIQDVVAYISFFDEPEITLGETIYLFGEPEYIYRSYFLGPARFIGSAWHETVNAISPDRGIDFGYDLYETPKGRRSIISSSIQVDYICFFAPEYYEMMANRGMFSGYSTDLEDMLEYMYPWKGYGFVDELYPYKR